jgi:integrase
MAKKKRSPHGSVSILNVSNNLHLRWIYGGKRFRFSMKLRNNPINMQAARAKAAQIERDIAIEQFDPTLERYKPQPIDPVQLVEKVTTIALWERWMDYQRLEGVAPQTLANRYQTIANLLKDFDRNLETEQDARDLQSFLLTTRKQSPATANRNIKMLKTFCNWAVKLGEMECNPFDEIKLLKSSGRSSKRDSFSLDEVHRILQTFRLHPLYFRYHDFVLMLMTFGLRPSEAIGLQWKDINFTQRTITIAESLSRTGEGSRRARRGRKNGTITVLNLPDEIYTMLEGRFTPTAKPNDLIFTSPTGKAIDDGNFAQRIWKPLLKQAAIPHRPPYNCRHSMASHAIDQGLTLPETAYLLGHKDTTMVSKVYGHMVNRPEVPKLTL